MTINQTAKWLSERDNFIILTHARPDGDTLGSATALAYGLQKLGKTAYVCKNPEAGDRYLKYVGKYFPPENFKPEYVVSVDTARRRMITQGGEAFANDVHLAIDHHSSNSGYAQDAYIDGDAAACGEIIYRLMVEMGVELDSELSTLLYIAISTDTGCFVYNNTTYDTLEIASKLVAAGAPNGRLNKEFFRTKERGRFMIEARIMSDMEFAEDGKIAIATVTQKLMLEYGVTEGMLEDIASLPGQIEGVKVGFLLKEQSENKFKVSCRTVKEVDANVICSKFSGGGHRCAAGCTIELPLDEAKEQLICAAGELL